MDVDTLIEKAKQICKANDVKKLSLFGSFAKGNTALTSDIDFIIYGCKDLEKLEKDLGTVKK